MSEVMTYETSLITKADETVMFKIFFWIYLSFFLSIQ